MSKDSKQLKLAHEVPVEPVFASMCFGGASHVSAGRVLAGHNGRTRIVREMPEPGTRLDTLPEIELHLCSMCGCIYAEPP